jgi:hypothetical protein
MTITSDTLGCHGACCEMAACPRVPGRRQTLRLAVVAPHKPPPSATKTGPQLQDRGVCGTCGHFATGSMATKGDHYRTRKRFRGATPVGSGCPQGRWSLAGELSTCRRASTSPDGTSALPVVTSMPEAGVAGIGPDMAGGGDDRGDGDGGGGRDAPRGRHGGRSAVDNADQWNEQGRPQPMEAGHARSGRRSAPPAGGRHRRGPHPPDDEPPGLPASDVRPGRGGRDPVSHRGASTADTVRPAYRSRYRNRRRRFRCWIRRVAGWPAGAGTRLLRRRGGTEARGCTPSSTATRRRTRRPGRRCLMGRPLRPARRGRRRG